MEIVSRLFDIFHGRFCPLRANDNDLGTSRNNATSGISLFWFSRRRLLHREQFTALYVERRSSVSFSEYRCFFHLMDVVSCYDTNNVASRERYYAKCHIVSYRWLNAGSFCFNHPRLIPENNVQFIVVAFVLISSRANKHNERIFALEEYQVIVSS